MEAAYQILSESQITRALFSHFNRRQEVKRCWRKEQGRWILKDIAFVDDWSEAQYEFLVKCLKNTGNTGGLVFGAFMQDRLSRFCSVGGQRFRLKDKYVQLCCIHM